MTHVTCRLTAKNRDQLRNLTSVIEYGLPLPSWRQGRLLAHCWQGVVEITADTVRWHLPRYIASRAWAPTGYFTGGGKNQSPCTYLPRFFCYVWITTQLLLIGIDAAGVATPNIWPAGVVLCWRPPIFWQVFYFFSLQRNYYPWDTWMLKTTHPECTISHHFATKNS